ncbi:MAG TPA: 2-oxoacid:acceptor oxidoreductase subunit alpha [bacterium]|nr:2-oxoacid:acceptor oxidoreductase subunit alpha [bacterium]
MAEYSVLVGGQAGDGIRQVGSLIAHLFSSLGYRIYFWDDYPSLIRGGHNFSIIRASDRKIGAYTETVDVLVALNQTVVEKHASKLKPDGLLVFDSDAVKANGLGLPLASLVKQAGGKPIMRNVAALGAIARTLGLEWPTVRALVQAEVAKQTDLNLKIAEAAYNQAGAPRLRVEPLASQPLPLIGGNEAIALGAVRAGLKLYIAYPMTPSSNLLHFLAQNDQELGIVAYHPENEIAAVITAIGGAYAGTRTMVGTSGGGFALMVEGLSLAAASESPVVFVVGQRPGPSTGLPTYTCQSDLFFILNAGHGEFVRFVVAPGDPDEAFLLTGLAMNTAWKYQIPAFVISDKNLSEGSFSFEARGDEVTRQEPLAWGGKGNYRRYERTVDGVSPLAFPGRQGAIVKANSYEHDEYGITTEEAEKTVEMQDKRLGKRRYLVEEVERLKSVKVYGDATAATALVTWGSTKGACVEVAEDLGLRVIQPLVLDPLPSGQLGAALAGVKRLISVENNATGCLARLLACHGVVANDKILKYDGRPFAVDDLRKRLGEVLR